MKMFLLRGEVLFYHHAGDQWWRKDDNQGDHKLFLLIRLTWRGARAAETPQSRWRLPPTVGTKFLWSSFLVCTADLSSMSPFTSASSWSAQWQTKMSTLILRRFETCRHDWPTTSSCLNPSQTRWDMICFFKAFCLYQWHKSFNTIIIFLLVTISSSPWSPLPGPLFSLSKPIMVHNGPFSPSREMAREATRAYRAHILYIPLEQNECVETRKCWKCFVQLPSLSALC